MEQEPEGGACLNALTFTVGLRSVLMHGMHPTRTYAHDHKDPSTHANKQPSTAAHTHGAQSVCKHSAGSARHMWAFAKIKSPRQRTSVKWACMKKHKKHFVPHTYLMFDSQGQSKSSPRWRPLESPSRINNFHACFVSLFHKHVMLLEFQLL